VLVNELRRVLDGALLEVLPEREVAEHLEERQVMSVEPDLVDVLRPEALLRRRRQRRGRRFAAEEVRHLRLHPRGRQQRRAVAGARNERPRRQPLVALRLEEGEESLAEVGARPHTNSVRAAMIGPMESILQSIGNTPLVRLRRCVPANGAELWLKLEYRNPTGSMKDRMALAMIEGAERDELVSPGDTIVEYTGGSTGPALAFVCRAKGYRALIVIADCFTEERFQLMRALGAELDVVPSVEGRPKVTAEDVRNMVVRAAELAAQPGHYGTDQFNNPYIVPDHRDRLGREIWEQAGGRVTAFCHGMGTASSLVGVSAALRPHGVYIQGHEPAGSAAITGGAAGTFLIQGWTGFVMPHWDPDVVDHVEAISDSEALEMTTRLAAEEGVFAGISSGANVVGALRLAERLGPDAVIVTLAVDTGFKYLSVSPYAELV
jgi:cysteine synthase A